MSYIKCEDVKRLISESCNECLEGCAEFDGIYPDCDKCLLHGVKSELEEIPAADVVEVVRCEGCKHCLKEDEYELWCYGRGFPARLVRADDYCSYGAGMRGENNEI